MVKANMFSSYFNLAQGYRNPFEYTGNVSFTYSGEQCVRWDSVSHFTDEHNELFPEGSRSAAENYCRSLYENEMPWCFLSPDTTVKSYCPIPQLEGKFQWHCKNAENTATNPSPSSHIPVGLTFLFHNFESKI